jgi:hypothetical protein
MLIESTIHIHKDILEILNRGAEITGRTRTFLIKLLMQRVMNNNQQMLKSSSRIKYQRRDAKENWYQIHIVINEYEYEYYQDMRKFYKMSVSFILAYAIRRYSDEILSELLNGNKNTDNYFYKNYIFIKRTIDGITCWQIYWGIPLNRHGLYTYNP